MSYADDHAFDGFSPDNTFVPNRKQFLGFQHLINVVARPKHMPPGWYLLLLICAVCGALAWYTRNFTEKIEFLRLVAGIGICSMIALVIWTWQIT